MRIQAKISYAARVQQELFHVIQATTWLPSCRSYLQQIVLIEHFSSAVKPLARVRASNRGEFTCGAKRVLLVLSIRLNKFPRDLFHCTKGMKRQTLESIVVFFWKYFQSDHEVKQTRGPLVSYI